MLLQYVVGCFIITLFSSQVHVQGQDPVFECYSWGDPHVQVWHPKIGGAIKSKDCYQNGQHTLVSNPYFVLTVHIKDKLTNEVDVKFYDPTEGNLLLCNLHTKNFQTPEESKKCEKHGITLTTTLTGTQYTYNIEYPAANILTSIREQGNCATSCYYNIYVWQPQFLVDQSTGACINTEAPCTSTTRGADDLGWAPVKSGSQRQFITNEQATTICNKYIDAFFVQTSRAPYQRSAHLNNTVANVLAGCTDDLIFTGQIELARSGLDVLVVEELTSGATSINAIQTALQTGTRAAHVILNDAAKLAEVEIRRIL